MNLIQKAIKLAKQNPEAFIGYFVGSYPQIVDSMERVGEGKLVRTLGRVVLDNGSIIQFIAMERTLNHFIGGYQFSHAVIDTDYQYEDWLYIRHRVRSHLPHKGMGVYDKYGAYLYYDAED